MRSQAEDIPLTDNGLSAEQVEELVRFVRTLDAHSDPQQLIHSLPSELSGLVVSDTAALVLSKEIALSGYIVDKGELATLPESQREPWQDEIGQVISEQPHPFVVSPLDREIRFDEQIRFDEAVQLFRERGNQSLCVLPLHTPDRRLGALCFARRPQDAFSRNEINFLSLIADYVALAIDDRLNFAHSETVQTLLESERTRLRLILDLNNSVVSNLDLREVLRAVSPGIRKIMHLDGVALILPDAANKQLELYALDFPNGKGIAYQNMSRPLDGSLAGQVFRTGKPWVGNIEDLNGSGFGNWVISGEGVETLCMLPLIRCGSTLGVLCLVRLEKNALTRPDIEFLTQIAGQVAIAIDNAFAYRRITELSDQLKQENLYLEDEIRSELNFEDIIGNSAALRQVLRQVEAVAPTNSTVLIQGETGSGKELVARAVHNLSRRRERPFVKLNCAAIPTGLMESELFGHEKGAFTGAIAQRIARFELASPRDHLPRRNQRDPR